MINRANASIDTLNAKIQRVDAMSTVARPDAKVSLGDIDLVDWKQHSFIYSSNA
jgi:hypothetical protein